MLKDGVVLAKPLKSREIRVIFTSQTEKNKALLRVEELKELKAYFKQEEFPIEVLSVPTGLRVEHGKGANNKALIEAIQTANKTLNRDLKITRIAWIHGKKSVQEREGYTPKRASLIIHTTTENAQKRAVLSGILLEDHHFMA